MKQVLFIISLIGLTQFSCKKSDSCDPVPTSLDGKWRMIIVKDNISGSSKTKPNSIKGDVDIVFTSSSATAGNFAGNTPSNSVWSDNYSTGQNQSLTILNLSMTEVAETSWGNEFIDNIINSIEYNFQNCDKLNIKTTNKTLIFQKQ